MWHATVDQKLHFFKSLTWFVEKIERIRIMLLHWVLFLMFDWIKNKQGKLSAGLYCVPDLTMKLFYAPSDRLYLANLVHQTPWAILYIVWYVHTRYKLQSIPQSRKIYCLYNVYNSTEEVIYFNFHMKQNTCTVKPVLETTCSKQSTALRDHCFNTIPFHKLT